MSPTPAGNPDTSMPPMPDLKAAQVAGQAAAGPVGFSPSMLPGVMQAMQESQGALQKLAQALPPMAPFIAQFLAQLSQAVPDTIMQASGQGGAAGTQTGGMQGMPATGGSMSAAPAPAPIMPGM